MYFSIDVFSHSNFQKVVGAMAWQMTSVHFPISSASGKLLLLFEKYTVTGRQQQKKKAGDRREGMRGFIFSEERKKCGYTNNYSEIRSGFNYSGDYPA